MDCIAPNLILDDVVPPKAESPAPEEVDVESFVAVDLFCGAGGLAYGLKESGIKVSVGVDLDGGCQFPLERNTGAKFERMDVRDVTADDINTWLGTGKYRILAGCAPCQPFSTYWQGKKKFDAEGNEKIDTRWNLLREFQRLVTEAKPELVTMENVVGLSKQKVWGDFVASLTVSGYHVHWEIVSCQDYGVPQDRKRLVLLASLFGEIQLVKPKNVGRVTVRDAIASLPPLTAGEGDVTDRLHVTARLSDLNLRRIKASKPGGTWRDWPTDLKAACHVKDSGRTYPSVYGRMEWDKAGPTMTTQCYGYGNGRFGHPEQDRAISLREAAIIQSFPTDYAFLNEDQTVSFSQLGTLIGNAVPPKLGTAIGMSIIEHCRKFSKVG